MRLRLEFASRAKLFRFCLREFGTLFASAIDRHAYPDTQHVVGAKLRRVGALPHVLHVEVGVKILARQVHLERLLFDHFLGGGDFRILDFGRSQKFGVGLHERRFDEIGGFDVRRILRAIEKLFDLGFELAHFQVMHGDFTKQFRLLQLGLQQVLLCAHARAVAGVCGLLHLL